MLDLSLVHILIAFLVLVFSLTVHESAHAWAADRLGDPTGRMLGRVSLNPMVHADPIGTLLFPLIAMLTNLPIIGWARPVPVDTRRLRNGRRDYLLIAAAGPASNLALAIIAAAVLKVVVLGSGTSLALASASPVASLLLSALEINLLLAIFNMIPVPPLDGSSVVSGLVPEGMAAALDRLRPYGFLVLYALMLTGALGFLVGPPLEWMLKWLL